MTPIDISGAERQINRQKQAQANPLRHCPNRAGQGDALLPRPAQRMNGMQSAPTARSPAQRVDHTGTRPENILYNFD
jgi:hypothetical protein